MKQYLVPWNKDMYTQHPPQRVYGRGAHRINILARVSGRSIRVSYRKVLAQTQSDWVSRALQNLLITYVYIIVQKIPSFFNKIYTNVMVLCCSKEREINARLF